MVVGRREFIKLVAPSSAFFPQYAEGARLDCWSDKDLNTKEKKATITFGGDTLLGGYYKSYCGTMTDLIEKIDILKSCRKMI
ncbi:MAG: hypothetical protein N3D84_02905 [Candidatus Woesearchaeota archaeon]|nr:hypothetical protein [Candidatus Woesearchaeota archaeon]